MTVRRAAVAGSFYPADVDALRAAVDAYLREGVSCANSDGGITGVDGSVANAKAWPKAVIAPHAGLAYSGAVAGSAYKSIAAGRATIRRVVMLGPAHRVSVSGIASSSADFFETPLGQVPVDKAALQQISVTVHDAAHAPEHSLETHLPFLQRTLKNFSIVPLVVGDASPQQVADVLEMLWGGAETLLAISSDLSHFFSYAAAQQLDAETARAIAGLRPEAIRFEQACGRIPIQGLLAMAPKHGLQPRTLDLRNSGDTAGGRDRVVGYGAWGFY